MVGTTKRALLLQTEATGHKLGILKNFSDEAVRCSNWILSKRAAGEPAASLQAKVLHEAKRVYGFNVQVICSLVRGVAKSKGNAVSRTTVKFNIPRNCKTFVMKTYFFVELGLYPGGRLAVPIHKNRNWDRFSGLLGGGWTCKAYGLSPNLEIVAYLSKDEKKLQPRMNVLGIDINAKNLAYTIITSEGNILKQGYLGQQMWSRKAHFEERRAMLQSLNALKKLKRMRHRQRNYIRTSFGQMVREIILIAKRYDADIAIERLSRFRPRGRRFNKKVMTIPFNLFRVILAGRCFDNEITLYRVDAYHTSKWCVRCGAVNLGHVKGNYALYRCVQCGLVMNSDRKASLAVAVKSFLERDGLPNQDSFQISGKGVPVSGLIRTSPMTLSQTAVPTLALERGKPTTSSRE